MKKRILFTLLAVLAIAGGGYGAWATWGVKTEAPKQVAVQKVEAPRSVYTPVPEEPKATVESLFAAVNAERAKVGVPALILDERLNQSAQAKADDMVENDYFAHADANGKHGYRYISDYAPGLCYIGGENIHAGSGVTAPTVHGWIDSKPHYAAMTSSEYVSTGFGIARYKESSNRYSNAYAIVEHFCQPN